MHTREFEYHLPEHLIAQTPLEPRDACRLLVIDSRRQGIAESRFSSITEYFRPGDVLVLNNTKVMPARLPARRPGGGRAEVFLLKDLGNARWEALVRPGRRVLPGSTLALGDGITVSVVDKTPEGGRVIEFPSGEAAERAMRDVGQVPLPPYIKTALGDPGRYQTIFASVEGSVAASTAALHFTSRMLDELKARGVSIEYVTLHMGLGSFRPISAERIGDHRMPAEYVHVPDAVAHTVNQARAAGGSIAACGTDGVRALESAARGDGVLLPYRGTTDLFITPGYRFKVVDRFITNLHLPRSSHLVLVSAFAGCELVREAYAFAVKRQFRFYTFGDATLVL
ncbi:MAG TPA: tRNA preQ1(34) S-adenosylmethionine ribosyltransferase-isomerase QueA [Clostridiales bacterium UBA8153]|nr:tRNA preQ1(34) S-adenosylmethionine ribosyltransferase-isomerase QueA [Clostridiales bacterium UBA8153]